MEKFNFRRRKCEVERYNRAKKLLNEITIQSLRAILEKEIAEYETKSEIINLFVNNPNLREEKDTDGTAKYTLPMRFVSFIDEKYQVVDGNIECRLYKENYVETWRNIGADYHALYVDYKNDKHLNGFWLVNSDLLEIWNNQDTLEERCRQMNLLKENYFI